MEHVERTVTLPTDLADSWELLTDPDELRRWLGDDVVLDPTPGATGRVVERGGSDRRLVVEEVDLHRGLTWRWWPEGDDPASGSRVDVTLAPDAHGGTVVRIVERPLPSAARRSGTPMASAMAWAHQATEAWSHRLLHLESLLLLAAVRG